MGSWGSSDECSEEDSKDTVACGSRVLDTYTRTNCTHKLQPHKQAKGAKRMRKQGWIENYPFCTGFG